MQNMASYGRNGDTMIGHLTPGETVVPQQVLQQNPQVALGLGRAFEDAGVDPTRYVVGSGSNSINPETGKPEFFLSSLVPLLTGALSNPTVLGALGNVALRKIQGKDVGLRDLLIGGIGGAGIGAATGYGTGLPFLDNMMVDSDGNMLKTFSRRNIAKAPSLKENLVENVANKSGYADGLLGYGEMLGINPESRFGKILNTKAGEGLASGLAAQLIDSLFSEDEDPDPYGNRARFERGAGENPISLKRRPLPDRIVPMYADGGEVDYYPRRNGGIMPNEGSGTEDDVPAMLTAGEFVMTRDAVKGAGNGNLNSGINKMYGMMDRLERKA
jgi:hypothetical protein